MQAHDFETPMMKQYMEIKKQYHDCLLFFRMGDFYELFLEDAKTGAEVLDIVLTSRAKGKDGRIPMAGVPYHAVDSYLSRLVRAGYKVAICEQMSEPDGRGIVDREVIRVVTPGTVLDEQSLEQKENNYIMSMYQDVQDIGFALADLTTGMFQFARFANADRDKLADEIERLRPAECVLLDEQYNTPDILKKLKKHSSLNIYPYAGERTMKRRAKHIVRSQFGKQVKVVDLETESAMIAAALLIEYLRYTQKNTLPNFIMLSRLDYHAHMHLDRATVSNLELFTTVRNQDKRGALISFIDKTHTAMGGRKLRSWIRHPLIEQTQIEDRHDAVFELLTRYDLRESIRDNLKYISDIERTASRITLGSGNARDLVALKESLKHAVAIEKLLASTPVNLLKEAQGHVVSEIQEIIDDIETHIVNEPPLDLMEGNLIKPGVDADIDALRNSLKQNKEWLRALEQAEQARTTIASLKVQFNKVFGYYIEVSNANLHLVPKDYIRKQTLVNAERYITADLKEKEEVILRSETQANKREYALFCDLRQRVVSHFEMIQQAADAIALLDCLVSFADLAEEQRYIRPLLSDQNSLSITGGRHPVVESMLDDQQFVPNDTLLNPKDHQLLIITGPNMAGKSVYLRQVAIIVLLNQIGSFVPAANAQLGIVDRIFVRSGASDMIADGLSTFMVEMVETAQILHGATSRSLVIMDEIGRGTSTYDGISIAWAVAEYLVTGSAQPLSLFATHYHELQELESLHPNVIKNYQMAIADDTGEPVFLYTIQQGAASHSYGVAVAKQAGLPRAVIENAWARLQALESGQKRTGTTTSKKQDKKRVSPVAQELAKVDINTLTPIEGLNILAQLKAQSEWET